MIRDRRRIANKLHRIQKYLQDTRAPYEAVVEVDQLRRQAKYDPQWKWEGFESEIAWAKHLWDKIV